MKRRSFIQRIGLGTSGLLLSSPSSSKNLNNTPVHDFSVRSYSDLVSKDGTVMIRICYSSTLPSIIEKHKGRFSVKNGSLKEIRSYFFHEGTDDLDPLLPGMEIQSYPGSVDIVVLWIENASEKTKISFPLGTKTESIALGDLVKQVDAVFAYKDALCTLSYLLDKEIGEIDPSEVGIKEQGDNFTFTAMADPQGGNPYFNEKIETRMRIHNAFIDESVKRINELPEKPAFNIVIGDIVDGQGQRDDFRAMNDMFEKVNIPTLYELGNHETKYNSVFGPGYNMSAFDNYFAAQKEFNGMNKLLYSFNLGRWHFIVWPDPLRKNFWETHPHYFQWLEKDLKKYQDRPTMFFQHVPIHPIGILPLINYAESVDVKRLLIDILSKHGNVKYVLSGHVHIPMKASVKTSCEYKGMQLINLPAAGYRPRAFGEEDYNGGPAQGFAIVQIEGNKVSIKFKTVTNEQFTYPAPQSFDNKKYPLWLSHKWELANSYKLENGDFANELQHWHQRYVYKEDVHPSNICESRTDKNGRSFLYLFNKSRAHDTPGQDRLPQSINRICQVLKHNPKKLPIFKLSYMIDPDFHISENKAGTYIWIEGFEQGLKRLNVVYSNDYIHWNLGGDQSQIRTISPVHLDISAEAGEWRNLLLNPYADFLRYTEADSAFLENIDTLAINFGVWTLNEGYRNEAAASYTDVVLDRFPMAEIHNKASKNNNSSIPKKEQKYLWRHWIDHVAGEHQSIVEDLNKYL